jgi:hypothetical protein
LKHELVPAPEVLVDEVLAYHLSSGGVFGTAGYKPNGFVKRVEGFFGIRPFEPVATLKRLASLLQILFGYATILGVVSVARKQRGALLLDC